MPAYSVTNPGYYLIHLHSNRRNFSCQPLYQKNETAYIYKLRFSQSTVRKFIRRNYFDNHSWKHTISYNSN